MFTNEFFSGGRRQKLNVTSDVIKAREMCTLNVKNVNFTNFHLALLPIRSMGKMLTSS